MDGQVALITGSAQGIGKKFAEILLGKGCKVCLSDILEDLGNKTAQEFRNKFGNGKVIFRKCDVTDETELEELFKITLSAFGRIDVVINNAGIIQEHNFRRMVEINLMAVVSGTRLAIKYMGTDCGGRGGVVVNMSSIAGVLAYDIAPGYTAVKHAVLGYTRAIGRISPKAHGIRIVAMCPSFTDTTLIQFDPEDVKKGQLYGPDVMARLEDSTGRSGGRFVTLDEIGECFRALIENETLSGHVMIIGVSGSGWAMRMPSSIDDAIDLYVTQKL